MKKILSLIAILLFSITLVGCQPNECPPNGEECEICDQCEKCEECQECEKCPEQSSDLVNVKLGIDLIDKNLALFEGKKVGLITNPTGVNSQYKTTIDVLYEKVNLTALFAPEHGIRGNSQAGGSIGNEIDAITGLTVYSLYGNTKKPTKAMLENVDVLCIDIQDVGARFSI